MKKIGLLIGYLLFIIILFSISGLAQDNTSASPNNTNSITPNATSTPSTTISMTTPAATGKKFSMAPSVSLTSTKTTVEATSPAILTMSMVNPIVNDVNLVVQPILKVPSGVDVIGTSFVLSGANQYTGLFTVRPGESNHVTIQITSDELGSKIIEAQLIYFPEDNKADYHQLQYTMNIYVKEKITITPTPIPPAVTQPPTPLPTAQPARVIGFEAIIAVIGVLVAQFLVKSTYKKR